MAARISRHRTGTKRKSTKISETKWFRFTIIAFLALGVVFSLAYVAVSTYLEGDSFRQQSEEQLNALTPHIQVDIEEPLQISGSTLALPKFNLQSTDKNQRLSIGELKVDLNRFALLNRRLHVEEASLDDLNLALNLDTISLEDLQLKLSKEDSHFLPNQWQLDQFTSNDTNTKLIIKNEPYRYLGYKVIAHPLDKKGKEWDISFSGGELETPFFWLEKAKVNAGKIIIKPSSIQLEETHLALAPGELTLRGLYKLKSGNWLTLLRAKKAPIAKLLDNDWKKRLSGLLDTSVELRGNKKKIELLTGSINILNAQAEALPILSKLRIANSYPYRSIDFDQASANVSYPYDSPKLGLRGAWLINDIVIHAKDKLLVNGYILIKQNRGLSGTLDIAIPENIHSKIPFFDILIHQQIFGKKDDDGYCWAKVNLSGTLDQPREDLSARLKSILSSQLSQTGSDLIQIFSSTAGRLINKDRDNSSPKNTPPQRTPASTPSPKQPEGEQPALIEQGVKGTKKLVDEGLKLLL